MNADKPKLLIVDDDTKLRSLLAKFLAESQYETIEAENGAKALSKLEEEEIDLIILDVMMPELDGYGFLENLPKAPRPPILMLTALGDIEERVKGLSHGADDYLPKPFDTRELLLRVEKLLERKKPSSSQSKIFQFGPFSFTSKTGELFAGEKRVELTTTEESLIKALTKAQGTPLSREALCESGGFTLSPRTIDVQINRLRKKLSLYAPDQTLIKTVRHQGYVLVGVISS